MSYGIRLVYLDGTPIPGEPWVRSYDPDEGDGIGLVESTSDPSRALQFQNPAQAWDAYQRQSTVRPYRPDGRPNKPMTAYSVSIESLP